MIIIDESITIEYKSEDQREDSIQQMKDEGFTVTEKYSSIDTNAMNHIYAKFNRGNKGYIGESIFKKSQ